MYYVHYIDSVDTYNVLNNHMRRFLEKIQKINESRMKTSEPPSTPDSVGGDSPRESLTHTLLVIVSMHIFYILYCIVYSFV